MANYVSEATLFLNELKAKNPELSSKQKAGRALLWDKQLDRNLQAGFKEAKVAQKPYVYQPE